MVKKQPKKTHLQELQEKLEMLNKKRLAAYNAGVGMHIIDQLERMIEEVQVDLYTETELKRYRESDEQDGEDWIV